MFNLVLLIVGVFEFSKYDVVAHSPVNINFNLTPTEEGLSPKQLGLLTFLALFLPFIAITLQNMTSWRTLQ